MANRIEVGFKVGIRDALGEKTKRRIIDNLALPVEKVATIEVYTIAGGLNVAELHQAAIGQAAIRNASGHSRIDDGAGGRA